ncbi:hypothetical protein GCM10009776_36740 [Microbacterium deminutum]|uniref:Uncharacterized protein n=1 Tax=Microbacterium deminutum TaxID=344164 RepID=A0ABN2RKG4_9MICO
MRKPSQIVPPPVVLQVRKSGGGGVRPDATGDATEATLETMATAIPAKIGRSSRRMCDIIRLRPAADIAPLYR